MRANYSELIKVEIGFRVSICEKIIFNAEVIGTASIIPTIPHIHPQKINEIRMKIGDRFRFLPVILGSMILPIINWVSINPVATSKVLKENPNLIIPIIMGNVVAIIDPKLGIKFNTKIRRAENNTKSNPPM